MSLLEKEWYIQAPWGRISIIAWGNCLDPPVLLCHGAVDSAIAFRPLIKLLPRNFYYIGMEFPGNGKSDHFPPGMMITTFDMVYPIEVVVKHFRWKQFDFLAHSFGTSVGKFYNLSYPGKMSKVIELDPTSVFYHLEMNFPQWYNRFFQNFYDNYSIRNSPKENAPKYKREKALEMLSNNRGLNKEAASMILDRLSEPVGDGLVRFTYDQRMKHIPFPPFSASYIEELYTKIPTPTLVIVASASVGMGIYQHTPSATDESAHPHKNYRVREVEGTHDVHVIHPERVAPYVSQFLLYGLDGLDRKAKL